MLAEKNGHARAWPFSSAMRCRIMLNVIFLTENFIGAIKIVLKLNRKQAALISGLVS